MNNIYKQLNVICIRILFATCIINLIKTHLEMIVPKDPIQKPKCMLSEYFRIQNNVFAKRNELEVDYYEVDIFL